MNNQIIFHISKFIHRLICLLPPKQYHGRHLLLRAVPSKCDLSFLSSFFPSFTRMMTQTRWKFEVRHEVRPTLSSDTSETRDRLLADNNAKTCHSSVIATLSFTREKNEKFKVYFNGHDAPTRNTCGEEQCR